MADDALRARQAERDRHCAAGDDLHAELLPPDHPLRATLPAAADHPRRDHIEAAQRRQAARTPLAADAPTRRGIAWATWVGSPNFTPGRAGHEMWTEPRFIVCHTMVGWESAARARFQQPSEQASSTYGVTLAGELFQYVSETDGPWTNGTIYGPIGGNLDSITLEHEDGGDYNGPRTPELYAASARAVRDIADFYGIPLDRAHVVFPHELGHRECTSAATACPDSLDLDRIVAAAAAGDDMTPDQDAKLTGLFNGWFIHDQKIDAIAAALKLDFSELEAKLPAAIDVNALAAALVAHLPAGADAQAIAKAVVAELASKLSAPPA